MRERRNGGGAASVAASIWNERIRGGSCVLSASNRFRMVRLHRAYNGALASQRAGCRWVCVCVCWGCGANTNSRSLTHGATLHHTRISNLLSFVPCFNLRTCVADFPGVSIVEYLQYHFPSRAAARYLAAYTRRDHAQNQSKSIRHRGSKARRHQTPVAII